MKRNLKQFESTFSRNSKDGVTNCIVIPFYCELTDKKINELRERKFKGYEYFLLRIDKKDCKKLLIKSIANKI